MEKENKELLTGKERDAYMEDFNGVVVDVIDKMIFIADKHNIDRDNAIQHFTAVFSAMVKVSTFEDFGKSGD